MKIEKILGNRRIFFKMTDKLCQLIEKLNWKNYINWSFKIETLMKREDCWSSITTECPVVAAEKALWMKADAKALNIIVLCVENSQLIHVRRAKTSKEAWDSLKKYHQKSTLSSKVRLLRKICKSELKKDGDLEAHLQEMFEAFDELVQMGSQLDDNTLVYLLLSSLNEDYDAIITALEGRDENTLTTEIVRAKLMEEYEKKKKVTIPVDSALQVSHQHKPMGYRKPFVKKNYAPNRDISQITCFECGQKGHYSTSCTKKGPSQANVAIESKEVAFTTSKSFNDGWFVDSGASSHICNDISKFLNLNESIKEQIIVASGEILQSEGRGKAQMVVPMGANSRIIPMYEVMYVPKAQCNLLSVKKLTTKGFKVCFELNKCEIVLDGEIIATANVCGDLYKIKEEQIYTVREKSPSLHNDVSCIHEWHKKLAHRNLNDIKKMKEYGLKIKDCECTDICEFCIRGKMSRKTFPKKASDSTNAAFDIVVSDVCGPMQEESVGGSRYFLTFIDVHSRFCEIFFIKQKSEVATKLIEYVERVKTKFGTKPKVIRSDRGSEYTCTEVQSYLRKEGIKFQCTVGYAPEQNGIAERKNRSLVEGARTILFEAELTKCWWAEAVHTVNYIHNRVITSATKKTPYEMYFNEKPRMTEFHAFGCEVYAMIPKEKRRKLDEKALKLRFVGYDEQSKGFRLANVSTRKVVISREVNFMDVKSKNIEKNPDNFTIYELEDEYDEIYEDPADNIDDEIEDYHSIVDENDISDSEDEVNEEIIPVRRTTRINAGSMPEKFNDYVLSASENKFEPTSFKDAMKRSDKNEWQKAMNDELNSIAENKTWNLVDLPAGRTAIGAKWVFKKKFDNSGNVTRYKARLVAQGFNQKFGTDYDEVFAPVARSTTFRMLLSVAAKKKYIVKHYDIKTAFLYGKLEEEIFMKQPPGFEKGNQVCKLNKSLYGLKQAARQWNNEINRVLMSIGCSQSETDKCLYIFKNGDETAYIIIHVDDLLIAGSELKIIQFIVKQIQREFEIKDLGEVKQFLGIDIIKEENGNYLIGQSMYIDKVVEAAGQRDAKVSSIPIDVGYDKLQNDDKLNDNSEYRKLIGMLLYISTNTRPDIAASVSILSQKVSCPTKLDLNEVKRVCRYLKGTRNMKLKVSDIESELVVTAFSDANWAENRIDRKSNSGYICMIGKGTISWCCRKQSCVSLSSTEAEYMALAETCQEVIWLRKICSDFSIDNKKPTMINEDNQSCMKMVDCQKFSNRTKHVDTKYHFIHDLKEQGVIDLEYCPTEENTADMLTKPLSRIKLGKLRSKANIDNFIIEEEC